MEDLYDNLENYHDENIIDELKNENMNLKGKLEEYSSAMIRLQNDFDKLNSEYRKLEMNYSSLLKTARAEIERKSDMIKSLNQEKDLLVIKALQTSGKNISNTRRPIFNDNKHSNICQEDNVNYINKSQHIKECSFNRQNEEKTSRNDKICSSTYTQSEGTTSSLENKSIFSENKESRRSNSYSKCKLDKPKENITGNNYKDNSIEHSVLKGQKIFNRRKSMPVSRIETIYSSDDDFEALNVKNIRKSPLRDEIRGYENYQYENRDNFYSSKDLYKNKAHRFIDHGKYKYDRYDTGERYKKVSPGNCRNKYTKEYSDSNKFRSENYSKRRELRSPPSDKYNRSKSRDRWDRRIGLEKEKHYHKDTYSPPYHDSSAIKHKIRNELEEPRNKRKKTDTVAEEIVCNHDREKEVLLKTGYTKHQDFIEPSSCQSPDYDNIDSTIPPHLVKEIKPISTTPPEDPRVASKKYLIQNIKEKAMLSTADNENIDLEPVNVSTWNLPNKKKFVIPVTIKDTPEAANKPANEMNMNMDKAAESELQESKEIKNLKDNDVRVAKKHDNSIDKTNKNNKNDLNLDRNAFDSLETMDSSKLAINKYKIPKIKKPESVSVPTYKNIEKGIQIHNTDSNNEVPNTEKIVHVENEQGYKRKNECDYKEIHENRLQAISTLADDLELSDEASEIKDLHKNTKNSKKPSSKYKICSTSVDLSKCQTNTALSENENKYSESKEICKPEPRRKTSKKVSKETSHDKAKPRKSKKETEQNDTIHSDVIVKTADSQEVPQFKDKDQKPPISSHTRNKFSDLFGDSSSLITPDDLGIPAPEIQPSIAEKYSSVFDNSQDATVVGIKEINKSQSHPTSSAIFHTVVGDISCNTNFKEKTDRDVVNITFSKDCDTNAIENMTVNKLYENTNSEIMNDASEIVKTVIISTGTQPTCTSEDLALENSHKNVEYSDEINIKKCALRNITALATSTPQKTMDENVPEVLADLNGSNNASKIDGKASVSCNVSNSSNHNTSDNLKEADVPDVRIFVRRRRKITKKP